MKLLKKLFEERDHLRYYVLQATEYLIACECQGRDDQRPANLLPGFVPEILTSCFRTLLCIKGLLFALLGLLLLLGLAALVVLC